MTLALKDFQVRGNQKTEDLSAAFLNVDRGLGKTPMTVVQMSKHIGQGSVEKILYVAPLSTLENVETECRRWSKNLRPIVLLGSRKKRLKLLTNRQANVFIINFAGVRVMIRELLEIGFEMIICDESTRIKDRGTQIFKAMKMLGEQSKYRRCLSGMPFTEGVQDAWAQYNFLDPAILNMNYFVFRNRYCLLKQEEIWRKNKSTGRPEKKKIHRIAGYQRLGEFEDKILPFTFRAASDDVLDLPPKEPKNLRVDMTDEQKRRYKIVQDSLVSEIEDQVIEHGVALAKMQKLRQVACGFMYDANHEEAYIPSRKYQELTDFLDDSMHGTRKVVIFTSFRAEPVMVENAVADCRRDMAIWHLPKKPTDRQRAVDEWTAEKELPAVLIANARSGGTGLNLQASDMAIFMSNDYRMEDRAQAEDRVRRIGSEIFDKIYIVNLITRDTIEEDILNALQSKRDLVEVFLERINRKQQLA